MKTWIQTQRLRKQRSGNCGQSNISDTANHNNISEASLPLQRMDLSHNDQSNSATRRIVAFADMVAPGLSSRLSFERHLAGTPTDEPTSATTTSTAIEKQRVHDRQDSATSFSHSRETTADSHSEVRRPRLTSRSVSDTVATQEAQVSRPHYLGNLNRILTRIDTESLPLDFTNDTSPDRLTASGAIRPVDMAKDWAEKKEKLMPGYSPHEETNYRAKAEGEMLRIRTRAEELERMIQQYKAEQDMQRRAAPKVTDASAHAIMAKNSKVAWLLGGDSMDTPGVRRRRSTVTMGLRTTERPNTAGRLYDLPQPKGPRKIKSQSALNDETRQAFSSRRHASYFPEEPPSKRTKYYCTFCQKGFYSRNDWLKHERTIHMLEDIWVCCPSTGELPWTCPFCEVKKPSSAHLASHNYMSCQEKPVSERTFARRDHFLQHISQVHEVSSTQRPARLRELEDAWRQPLPIKTGQNALHCGFCGTNFKSYDKRTMHVGRHFEEGLNMMSWWQDRVSHELQLPEVRVTVPNADLPHKCAYCERTFENLTVAHGLHPTCTTWSCSFLPGLQFTIYPEEDSRKRRVLCCYCNDTLAEGVEGKVNGALLKEHMLQHSFRSCSQELFYSGQKFRQHLQDNHKTTYDSSLFAGWTFLLKACQKERPSVFRQMAAKAPTRGVDTESVMTTMKEKTTPDRDHPQKAPTSFMELTDIPERIAPNKLRRKPSSRTIPEEIVQDISPAMQPLVHSIATDRAGTPSDRVARSQHSQHSSLDSNVKPRKPTKPLPLQNMTTCPTFYRRRLDASTRNRIYLRKGDAALSSSSQQMMRNIPCSVLGGLILHSSLAATVPARMTNSVDIYTLG